MGGFAVIITSPVCPISVIFSLAINLRKPSSNRTFRIVKDSNKESIYSITGLTVLQCPSKCTEASLGLVWHSISRAERITL